MIELVVFGLAPELKQSPLLPTVTEPIVVAQPPPEPTLEEKIASDYYKCEPLRYIRADTAECGAIRPEYRASEGTIASEPISTPVSTKNTLRAPQNWYEAGSCTYGAQILAPWVGRWKNANTWDDMARADGHIVSSIPIVGAVFVDNGGHYGHVGVVIEAGNGTVTVKDMNYRAKYQWATRTVPASDFVYIYPK